MGMLRSQSVLHSSRHIWRHSRVREQAGGFSGGWVGEIIILALDGPKMVSVAVAILP